MSVIKCNKNKKIKNDSANEKERAKDFIDKISQRIGGELSVTRAFGDYRFNKINENKKNKINESDEDDDGGNEIESIEIKDINFDSDSTIDDEEEYKNETDKNDKMHKLDGLICEPFINQINLIKESDEFLIIACDGIWDVISDLNAVKTCRRVLRKTQNSKEAAQKLVKEAKTFHSTDNMSVMVIGFADCKITIVKPIGGMRSMSRIGRKRRLFNTSNK